MTIVQTKPAAAIPVQNERAPSPSIGYAADWMTLIGTSETGGRDYVPRVEGKLPTGLRGSLYRNGPGLFERGGVSLKNALDGDGLIQRLSFTDHGVRYQNAFVQTEKFAAEQKSGKRLHASWSTRKNTNPLSNLGGGVDHSQAGVTVYPIHGKLLARDEFGPSYEIDPDNLATRGIVDLPSSAMDVGFKAHSKIDPETGEWILGGTKYGRNTEIHAAIYEPNFRLKNQIEFTCPRPVYIHDFIATSTHLIFVLHPCMFSPLPFLIGVKSFIDSFQWKADQGNLVAIISRSSGEPQFFEAPASFMWHALNAFDDGDQIVADFVGYDDPDHFIGEQPLLSTLMQGKIGNAACPGTIRRYRIGIKSGTLTEEILDEGNHEFPMLDERNAMKRHRFGYFAAGGLGAFNSGLKRLDYESGKTNVFDFGPSVQVGEPVFASAPDGVIDQGWLISQCLDANSRKTFFGIFNTQALCDGPVAKVWLEHHVPISFHGSWSA